MEDRQRIEQAEARAVLYRNGFAARCSRSDSVRHPFNPAEDCALNTAHQHITGMSESLAVKQADALNSHQVLITLSDGRALLLSLEQILGLHLKELSEVAEDEDSEGDTADFLVQ